MSSRVSKGCKMFDKVLIANRGEIACRVMKTCRELGIKTVAVYSEPDRNSQHVLMADEAFHIGEAAAVSSYLCGDKILDVCKATGAQAVHPGYGFLSENADFAKLCADQGVTFIGPPPSAITSMGSKSASKKIMTDAGVSCVPGYHGEDQSFDTISAECEKIGYPVMLKAVMGGGGKGMRVCYKAEDLQERLDACRREAMASFADDRMLVERFVEAPRHVEFQVISVPNNFVMNHLDNFSQNMADTNGDAVHLFERDCSVQRRHQKVLEEAPAPGLSPELRAEMGRHAVQAAKAVHYVGAGTVEFIFDPSDDQFYFMEMNTRLQVEHPVTEMITGHDLVELQLLVAAGHQLPLKQTDLDITGHSIEAQRPRREFLPGNGLLHHLSPPANSSVRVESAVVQGDSVSVHYDPMISKLVVHGPDREDALRRMSQCLREYEVVGVPTNIEFLLGCVEHRAFQKGGVDTNFIETYMDDLLPNPKPPTPNEILALAALSISLRNDLYRCVSTDEVGAWSSASLRYFRPSIPTSKTILLGDVDKPEGDAENSVKIVATGNQSGYDGGSMLDSFDISKSDVGASGRFDIFVDGSTSPLVAEAQLSVCGDLINAKVGGVNLNASVVHGNETLSIFLGNNALDLDGASAQYTFNTPKPSFGSASSGGLGGNGVRAPMPGKVIKVLVENGDEVVAGTPLMVLEAMKMEHVLEAPNDGIVSELMATPGDYVDDGVNLVLFGESD